MNPSLFLLDHFGFIEVRGKDAASFLQGQLTADVNAVTPLRSTLCARCTPQGRIVSLFRLFQYKDAYLLRLPQSMVQITIDSLKKFALFSKVSIEDKSLDFVAIGLSHPNDPLGLSLPSVIDESISNEHGYLTRVPGEQRFEYYIEQPHFYSVWENLRAHTHSQSLPGKNWHLLDLKAGIPDIHPETTEHYTAHDLNLPALNAVSFTKGCYSGQEIVARMHYRGTLKQHLYQGEMVGDVQYNASILNEDRTVGHVIDFEQSDSLSITFLALIRDEAIDQHLIINQHAITIK